MVTKMRECALEGDEFRTRATKLQTSSRLPKGFEDQAVE